jgi:hypothetical protein
MGFLADLWEIGKTLGPDLYRKLPGRRIGQTLLGKVVLTAGGNRFAERMQHYLSNAREVRLCGWTLVDTIGTYRHELQELFNAGRQVRLLLLDPELAPVSLIDSVISDTDPLDRRAGQWPVRAHSQITHEHLRRSINILMEQRVIPREADRNSVLRVSKLPLPCSLTMIETMDGDRWLSMQLMPIHPDIRLAKRVVIDQEKPRQELWDLLREQFDLAWEDPALSRGYPGHCPGPPTDTR